MAVLHLRELPTLSNHRHDKVRAEAQKKKEEREPVTPKDHTSDFVEYERLVMLFKFFLSITEKKKKKRRI
jgi:hypothetical protein